MQPFITHRGVVAVLDRENIDTDQIIPKQHLKRVERTGFGPFLFSDWRYFPDGSPRSDFVLNQPQEHKASILIAGKNFGCGSSREHAAWALMDFGFRAVIAPSFADIFRNNAGNNGLLVVELPERSVQAITRNRSQQPGYELEIDLQAETITDNFGLQISFAIDPSRRSRLLEGLDEIGLTLMLEAHITAFEQRRGLSTYR
ncbi:MAG: 3-isopropylmalate dehydratase small subunit [Candidatus Korobacteraceae bacterium]